MPTVNENPSRLSVKTQARLPGVPMSGQLSKPFLSLALQASFAIEIGFERLHKVYTAHSTAGSLLSSVYQQCCATASMLQKDFKQPVYRFKMCNFSKHTCTIDYRLRSWGKQVRFPLLKALQAFFTGGSHKSTVRTLKIFRLQQRRCTKKCLQESETTAGGFLPKEPKTTCPMLPSHDPNQSPQ